MSDVALQGAAPELREKLRQRLEHIEPDREDDMGQQTSNMGFADVMAMLNEVDVLACSLSSRFESLRDEGQTRVEPDERCGSQPQSLAETQIPLQAVEIQRTFVHFSPQRKERSQSQPPPLLRDGSGTPMNGTSAALDSELPSYDCIKGEFQDSPGKESAKTTLPDDSLLDISFVEEHGDQAAFSAAAVDCDNLTNVCVDQSELEIPLREIEVPSVARCLSFSEGKPQRWQRRSRPVGAQQLAQEPGQSPRPPEWLGDLDKFIDFSGSMVADGGHDAVPAAGLALFQLVVGMREHVEEIEMGVKEAHRGATACRN